jgi:hypothetical protein
MRVESGQGSTCGMCMPHYLKSGRVVLRVSTLEEQEVMPCTADSAQPHCQA